MFIFALFFLLLMVFFCCLLHPQVNQLTLIFDLLDCFDLLPFYMVLMFQRFVVVVLSLL